MGITNIHVLMDPDHGPKPQILAAQQHIYVLMEAHKRGEHPPGMMRRLCPLCQAR